MDRKLLAIYLNDHLAGSVVEQTWPNGSPGRTRAMTTAPRSPQSRREIEEDKATLREVMDRADVRRQQTRLSLARLTELATRLKPNGRLVGYSPLSRVLELEGLTIGITGKLGLWRSLETLDHDSGVPDLDYTALATRAEDQRDRVEELRVRAAREALSGEAAD